MKLQYLDVLHGRLLGSHVNGLPMRAKSSKQRCPALCITYEFNRLRANWPKGYQRGSIGKSHHYGLPVMQRLQVRFLREDNFFALLVFK